MCMYRNGIEWYIHDISFAVAGKEGLNDVSHVFIELSLP